MKKLFIALLMNLTLFGANIDKFANEMGFERDYNAALLKSKKENKILVMVLGADYCPWCRKFESKTLSDETVKLYLNENMVTLIVDKKYDKDSFPTKYATDFTPMVFFIDPKNEDIIDKTIGYVKKKDFFKTLNIAQELHKSSK